MNNTQPASRTTDQPTKYFPVFVADGVESQMMFGTDFPVQGGFYPWKSTDVRTALTSFYQDELAAIRKAWYSEMVMSENFKRYMFPE